MKIYGLYQFRNGLKFTGIVSESEEKIIEYCYNEFYKKNLDTIEYYQLNKNYERAIKNYKKNIFNKCYQIHELKNI